MSIDPVRELRMFVSQHPTQKTAAKALGISQSYLIDLLHDRRRISDVLLGRLGLTRTVTVRRSA